MKYIKICLADYYPFLSEYDSTAYVEIYVQEDPVKRENIKPKNGMIVCPGSGYSLCARIESEPVAVKLLAMNFNAFVITYSCAPSHHPVQLLEIAALYDLIEKNKEEWNTDISKTGIMGFSAGGHLAAHYSNRYNCGKIAEYFKVAHKPYVSVLCYPVISADKKIRHENSFFYLLGHVPSEAECEELSCEKMVSENTPPTFIWHTVGDTGVPVQNSLRYAEALSNNGVPYALHIYPFGDHGLSTVDDMSIADITEEAAYAHDWLLQLEKWMKLYF